jgi:heme/copper-type cytochrome/quinol oxidase subunit 3
MHMSTAHGDQVRVLEEHGQSVGRSLNWWGMMFFIASEALIFANLIAAYLYLEIRDPNKWVLPVSGDNLNWIFSGFNTLLLVSSSFVLHYGMTGIAKGNVRRLIIGLTGTIILGSGFLAGQIYEYTDLFGQNFTIGYKTFGSAFFTLTGFHGLHVTIGVLFLIIILVRALRGHFSGKSHFAAEAGTLYWHFVDIVWLFVYSIVYLLPLLRG